LLGAPFALNEYSQWQDRERLAPSLNPPNEITDHHYGWHLSGSVMPVPPYGASDIPGSDTASKLIVQNPGANTIITIIGSMKGLRPDTTYSVFLSNGYSPHTVTGWNVQGRWKINYEYQGGYYPHDAFLIQSSDNLSGIGGHPSGGPYSYIWSITRGKVSGDAVHLVMNYTDGAPGTTMIMDGIIAPDGTVVGTWSDNFIPGNRTGSWTSVGGNAIKTHSENNGWPGLFTPSVQPFTFTTDAYESGNWQISLRNTDVMGTGPFNMSVWINDGGTLLISDNIQVVN
jgi:hypothetical protein